MATTSNRNYYKDADEIDRQRRDSDFLFQLIAETDERLNEIINLITKELRSTYPTMSKRLQSILQTIETSSDSDYGIRVLKHGLLFFALANEPWAVDILTSRGIVPPERYELFYKDSLVPASQNLLNGVLTSLWAYVEQVRGDYVIS